jgi:hypothetical protein
MEISGGWRVRVVGLFDFSHDLLSRTATRIINEVKGINRVVCTSPRSRPGRSSGNDFGPAGRIMRKLGVSRQTVLQRVKRGEIEMLHVRRGRQKGLRLNVIRSQASLFEPA